MSSTNRAADPWRDTDVIDARAPRFNQAVVGLVALAAAIFGWPLLWALMGLQLFLGLTLGRRFCLTCVAYFTLIQPRFGEGELEDSRPPRLANMIGCAFLGGAALAWWLGAPAVGVVLGLLVAALALLAAASGFCTGCEIYKLGARLRGISPRRHDRIEPGDLGADLAARTFVSSPTPFAASAATGSAGSPAARPAGQDRCARAARPRSQVRDRRGPDRARGRPRGPRRGPLGALSPLLALALLGVAAQP